MVGAPFFENERAFVEIYYVIPSILVSDFIIITKARLYNTSAGSKSKAKEDAVLKFLFITDMQFYKGTTFTSFFVCIHWKYLFWVPLFSFTLLKIILSLLTYYILRKIEKLRSREITYFVRHFDFSIVDIVLL